MNYIVLASWQEEKAFNDWLANNAWWLSIAVAALILVVVLSIFLFGRKNKKKAKKAPKKEISKSAYMDALGGEDNLISHSLTRSRIVLELKNYDLVDKEKLKEAGVDSFIMMSNKLTLVIKENAETVNKTIFGA